MWIWVLSITVLGSQPEHVTIAKFNSKQECIQALKNKENEYKEKSKLIVGSCYYSKTYDRMK